MREIAPDSKNEDADPAPVTEAEVDAMEQTSLGAGHPVALAVEDVEAHRNDRALDLDEGE